MHASTLYAVLRRAGLSVLARLDRTTRSVIRYERGRPGQPIHLDIKKLGRIPDFGGKRFDPGFASTGSGRKRRGPKRGHDYIHVAVERVITDHGVCYRSQAFATAAAELGVRLKRTRPFRPQTNGKAEALNKTIQRVSPTSFQRALP